ncbi:hypothetical protein [Bradyrhizobium sp. SZCCHNRI2007]|uniref:hypothetical protein n=1 Tax=unclassified Bradyrhizobium TaxID=2631580 RepID=UPI0039657A38
MSHGLMIAAIGGAYAGSPVAAAFVQAGHPAIGFDIDVVQMAKLEDGRDSSYEIPSATLNRPDLHFTTDPSETAAAACVFVTVPIDSAHEADLGSMLPATRALGKVLEKEFGRPPIMKMLPMQPKTSRPTMLMSAISSATSASGRRHRSPTASDVLQNGTATTIGFDGLIS